MKEHRKGQGEHSWLSEKGQGEHSWLSARSDHLVDFLSVWARTYVPKPTSCLCHIRPPIICYGSSYRSYLSQIIVEVVLGGTFVGLPSAMYSPTSAV